MVEMGTPIPAAAVTGVAPRTVALRPLADFACTEGAWRSSSGLVCTSGLGADTTESAIRSASRSYRSLGLPTESLACTGKLLMEAAPPAGGNEPPAQVEPTAASAARLLELSSAAAFSLFVCTWPAALRVLLLESAFVVSTDKMEKGVFQGTFFLPAVISLQRANVV